MTAKLVLAVSAEAHRPAEEELRNSRARGAKGGAAFTLEKNRRRPCNGLKISQFEVHRRKPAVGTRTLVEPAEIRFRAETAPRNHGIVGVVQQVVQPGLSHAPCHGGNFGRT